MNFRLTILAPLLALSAHGQQTVAQTAQASAEPYVIEDGGVSLQTTFWMPSVRPILRSGEIAVIPEGASSNVSFSRKFQGSGGVTFSLPAGKQNSFRISYFRSERSSDFTAASDLALFSVGYAPGDYITTDYKFQHVKLSWDYLSYTFESSGIRFKTLWEGHYVSVDTVFDAPLKEIATDDDGLPVSNTAYGKKWLVLPALGIGLGHAPSKHFRWEAKASGFGIPHRSALWDAEASAVLRFGNVELLAGGRMFGVKTNPRDDAYFKQTLAGPYVALRWYWGGTR